MAWLTDKINKQMLEKISLCLLGINAIYTLLAGSACCFVLYICMSRGAWSCEHVFLGTLLAAAKAASVQWLKADKVKRFIQVERRNVTQASSKFQISLVFDSCCSSTPGRWTSTALVIYAKKTYMHSHNKEAVARKHKHKIYLAPSQRRARNNLR